MRVVLDSHFLTEEEDDRILKECLTPELSVILILMKDKGIKIIRHLI